MFLITVTPISKKLYMDDLSYYSSKEVADGALVRIRIRNKIISGIVTKSEPLNEKKTEVKSFPFTLRKIESAQAESFLASEFVKAARKAETYFAAPFGSIFKTFIPSALTETNAKVPGPQATPKNAPNLACEKFAMQTEEEERFSFYKSYIREEFAKKRSVFFCLPTIQDLNYSLVLLGKGIEQYTMVLHGGMSRKNIIESWKMIAESEHPIVVVATPHFLSIPRSDIGTIIVEREQSTNYKEFVRPFIDFRWFAEKYAELIKAKIIFGDTLLRIETIHRKNDGELLTHIPLKYRPISDAEQIIVNINDVKNENTGGISSCLSPLLIQAIEQSISDNRRFFIFGLRRGYSPVTTCNDCGFPLVCEKCASPLVLHAGKTENFFLCHKCFAQCSPEVNCKKCGSWNLTSLSIGVEKIVSELLRFFPQTQIASIDSDSTPTPKAALSAKTQFLNSRGGILVGTEMALNYIREPVSNVAIVSIDALFSIPDFRINEKIMSVILKLRSLARSRFILQTADPKRKIFEYGIRGNLLDFCNKETQERKKFGYPPFKILIKITHEGDPETCESEITKVVQRLEEYSPVVFPAFVARLRGKTRTHIVLKLDPKSWPDSKLSAILRNLPPQYIVNVDPETIL